MKGRALVRRIHPLAGLLALLTILLLWTSTVSVEVFGSQDDIVALKRAIPWALLVLVPALAATGGTGFALGGRSIEPRILAKKRRMCLVAATGLLVLVPCVLYLGTTATVDELGASFYIAQGVELAAGALNITLISLNVRDGLRLSGRRHHRHTGQ